MLPLICIELCTSFLIDPLAAFDSSSLSLALGSFPHLASKTPNCRFSSSLAIPCRSLLISPHLSNCIILTSAELSLWTSDSHFLDYGLLRLRDPSSLFASHIILYLMISEVLFLAQISLLNLDIPLLFALLLN